MKFEEGLERLEELVQRLEKGDLSLDESLSCFEQGMKFSKLCQEKLESAQAKIGILNRNEQGKLSVETFKSTNENEE